MVKKETKAQREARLKKQREYQKTWRARRRKITGHTDIPRTSVAGDLQVELDALGQIADLLEPMQLDQQRRIMGYLTQHLGMTS